MSRAVSSHLDFQGVARAVNLLDPSSAQDAATKAYVDRNDGVSNAMLANVVAGTQKGLQLDAASPGDPVDLTGAEQGENLRFGFVQVIALAAGTYDDVEIDVRAKIVEFVPTGDVLITGFKLVLNPLAPGAVGTPGTPRAEGNVGGFFKVYKHGFNSRLILRNYNAGSVSANQIGCPNTVDFVLEQAATGVDVQYTSTYSKWQPLGRHSGQIIKNGTGSISTRDLTNLVEGTGISITLSDSSTLRATNVSLAINLAAALNWTGVHSFGNALLLATVHSETAFVAGTPNTLNVTLNAFATRLYILISGDGELQSVAPASGNPAAGRVVYCQIVGTGLKRIKHGTGASHPTLPGNQANLLCPNNRDLILGNRSSFLLIGDGSNGWLVSPLNGGDVTPWQLAPVDSMNMAATFSFRVAFAAGTPGTSDEVSVYLGAHFSFRITRVDPLVSTAIAGQTLELRTAAGGAGAPAGSALSHLFSAAAVGPAAITTPLTATTTVAAGGNVYLRRSDRGVAGEVVVTAMRT